MARFEKEVPKDSFNSVAIRLLSHNQNFLDTPASTFGLFSYTFLKKAATLNNCHANSHASSEAGDYLKAVSVLF